MATTIATQIATLIDFVGTINKGTFGTTLIAVTEPKMNKRGNALYGRVHKATCMVNVALGYSYENTVNNRLAREGKENDFESQKPFGKSWVVGLENILLVSDKNAEQYYLRTTMLPNTNSKSVYLVDGRRATEEEVEIIKTFLVKSSKPSNQGLSEEHSVIVRDYKLEGVLALTQGAKEYNVLSSIFDIATMRGFFK